MHKCFVTGCLDPLGIEKGSIEDAWMSASTYLDSDHKPSMGRLNNPQGWCAAADKKQFLTVCATCLYYPSKVLLAFICVKNVFS